MEEKLTYMDVPIGECTGEAQRTKEDISLHGKEKAAIAAVTLKEGGEWLVTNENCEAAVTALETIKPQIIKLVARDDTPDIMPLAFMAALAAAAKDCQVQTRFLDSFFQPQDTERDKERLRHFLDNSSLRMTEMCGYLDAENISSLPHSIEWLGLAINSAADAEAVSAMNVWGNLAYLHVSVSLAVPLDDLKPLPTVASKRIHFYGLTDEQVDSVQPAIEALVPEKKFPSLFLAKCQLTAEGVDRLAQQLCGVEITRVTIDTNGPWRPDSEERDSVSLNFLNTLVGCVAVQWNMDWIYK